jgi:phosphoglucosamine mutase
MQLFGTSGIRGIVNRELVNLAFKVGMAVGETYHSVVIGSDTRTSGDVLKHAVISGLLAAGAGYDDAGIVPTPTLAYITREYDAGIIITASHNPPEYNGMKLVNPDGSAFDASQRKQLEESVAGDNFIIAPWVEMKGSSIRSGAIEEHIDRILQDFPAKLKLKVVVDAGCGAASLVTPRLLEKLGCEVITQDCHPCGCFPRGIEPTESNLKKLMETTKENGADLGIAHDGDADRMMAVDDKGRFIPGDSLLAIFARLVGAKEMVTTVDASMAIDEMEFNARRVRVGDVYVSEELRNGGNFGGEPSGSWVFPSISFCPDGIYAAAQIASIASRQKLSELVDSIPVYPILRGDVSSNGVVIADLESRLITLKSLSTSNVDGIKLNFKDGWLLVRASGTEPIIRLTAESNSEKRVRQLYDAGLRAIKESVRGKEKVA